jgi:hypothetical protein
MVTFTVHEPPDPPADRLDRAESLIFVRDGLSLSAALLAPLWMALHGLWLALAAYAVVVAALTVPFIALDVQSHWAAVALLGLHLVIGWEAASLRRWTLDRRGYRFVASVAGRSAADCERRFFEAWLPGEPPLDHSRLAAPAATMSQAAPLRSSQPSRPWWRLGSTGSP